jgi:hypothetical protein
MLASMRQLRERGRRRKAATGSRAGRDGGARPEDERAPGRVFTRPVRRFSAGFIGESAVMPSDIAAASNGLVTDLEREPALCNWAEIASLYNLKASKTRGHAPLGSDCARFRDSRSAQSSVRLITSRGGQHNLMSHCSNLRLYLRWR